jgi:hypothetical protein
VLSGRFRSGIGIAESFEVKQGRSHEIEAVMIKLPYGAGTGWEK